jgi:hypothetical protein
MSWRLRLLESFFPPFLKRRKLGELETLTAGAFRKERPSARAASFEDELRRYATFTGEAADDILSGEADPAEVRARLFEAARASGSRLRRQLGVRTAEDARRALRLVYGAIRIDLSADPDGQVVVRRCYFSRTYRPEVCRLISALDEGLAAGLTGGAKLEFSQRITEGKDRCLGRLVYPREGS